jgi:hypothetical protein
MFSGSPRISRRQCKVENGNCILPDGGRPVRPKHVAVLITKSCKREVMLSLSVQSRNVYAHTQRDGKPKV